jgi:hypothetical protein
VEGAGVGLKMRVQKLWRRRQTADDGYCPGHPTFFPEPIDWRRDLADALDPDPAVRAAGERRLREQAARPCAECGRPKAYTPIRWVASDEWGSAPALRPGGDGPA